MWERKKEPVVNGEHFTVLGKDVVFKGIVHFQGTVQLDSRFDGEIHTTGVLVVGEHAAITGTITAGTVVSNGKIRGDITASAKVQLLKSAVLVGNVHAPSFSMEEGAYFRGTCEMGENPWKEPAGEAYALAEPASPPLAERLLLESDSRA